jgi:phosphoglycolate phosphatase
MLIKEKFVFWDWNGTLLDDTDICLTAMNLMLAKRKMEPINLEYYKEVFRFPVIEYYKSIGFDFSKESFETISLEFIEIYNSRSGLAKLMTDTKKVLGYFQQSGKRNIILSVMQQDMLVDLINRKGIRNYFTDIIGMDNIYAHSKSTIGLEFVRANGIVPKEVVLIGDTLHDFEVANDIGCRCILIANGHQSEERLKSTGAEVVRSLLELLPDSLY